MTDRSGRVKRRIVLATRNPDKVREIRHALADLDVALVPVSELRGVEDVAETGATLEENAVIKAREVARQSGLPALADDTGLEVTALDGAPGVISARYAGEDATYADNCRKLLDAMTGVAPASREARFRTVVALAQPDGTVATVEGVCDGEILEQGRGEGGFGYDPVFRPRGESRTFAEMPLTEKNRISHRGRAFRAARRMVEAWLE